MTSPAAYAVHDEQLYPLAAGMGLELSVNVERVNEAHSDPRLGRSPRSAALYLNADLATARSQLERILEGYPAGLDDLGDDAFLLVAARLPVRVKVDAA